MRKYLDEKTSEIVLLKEHRDDGETDSGRLKRAFDNLEKENSILKVCDSCGSQVSL